ncbi:uncharacterized protein TNCV_153581 [Trichonephila clavipes]|nr:uncharacterized protein TNCV_153581 [Trichonephila clavipes]
MKGAQEKKAVKKSLAKKKRVLDNIREKYFASSAYISMNEVRVQSGWGEIKEIYLFDSSLTARNGRACLTKCYNKLRSLESRNHTSAYFKDWCNNQRLRRNSPFSQMVSFNLTIGVVEPHHLSQCLGPVDDLDGVFFHPET